jgi:hypothetical protein
MCLIMFVFLWLVMLTAWWRCADACQEQHQESPRGTKHWLRISASSSWREAYSPCKVYCCDYQNYCWDYSPLELNIITWNIMDIIGIAIEFSIYIFFFAHVFLTWRELLGIVLQKIDFETRPVPTFDQHWPWLSRRNLRHFLDLRRRLGRGSLTSGTSQLAGGHTYISQCHDIHSQSLPSGNLT